MRCFAIGVGLWFLFAVSMWSAGSEQPSATHFSSLPATAQSSISAAIGRDDTAYAARRLGEDFHVDGLHSHLTVDFNSKGVSLQAGDARWGLALLGYGYGEELRPLAVVSPQAKLNRVEYRRGSLTEWYVNGPAGLEPGFTLASAPGRSRGQPLTVALTVAGASQAMVEKDGRGLKLGGMGGGRSLRYSGLNAYYATGKELRAWLEWSGRQLRVRVDDARARYPVMIDPWVQLAELSASDHQPGDDFSLVTIFGDTIVVGAPLKTINGKAQQGAAYVFIKPKTGWTNATETAELTASDGESGDAFGFAVATNDEAVVIGASFANIGSNRMQGAAYVFLKPKQGWRTTSKFTAKLTASDGKASDFFGHTLAISGNTLAVTGAGRSLLRLMFL